MPVAVARHTRRERPRAGVFPGEPGSTALTELAGEPRRTGTGLHPRGGGGGQAGGEGRRRQGHLGQRRRVWRRKDVKSDARKEVQG